jgi:acyl carrier protein
MEKTIKDKLNSIIDGKIRLSKSTEEIGDNEDLSNYGLNSISIIRLIISIEENFGFEVDEEDLTIERFNTIANMCEYIQSRVR